MTDVRELIAYSSDPALVVNGRQTVLAINQAASELLGRSLDDTASPPTCNELLNAATGDGRALCSTECSAMNGLRHLHPYASGGCFIRCGAGGRVAANLRTLAIPGDPEDFDRPVAIIFVGKTEPPKVASAPPDDPRLRIMALGRFGVAFNGQFLPLEKWPRKQAVQLLKLLVTHVNRPLHRELLIERFWPDADAETGWNRLKVTVHCLRQCLREAGFDREAITTIDSSYLLQAESVWIDARSFETLVRDGRAHQRAGRAADAIRCYEEAKRIYRGDFMEGDLYADWCAEERERLCEIYIETLNALAELHFRQGEFAAAAQECHVALLREPCRESVHRLLMQSLIELKRYDGALRQFERCRQVLRTELGVQPSPETARVIAPLIRPAMAAGGRPHHQAALPAEAFT